MEESRKSAVWEGILEFWSLEEVPPRERVDRSLHPFLSQPSIEQARRQCEPEKSCRGFCSHLCFLSRVPHRS